MTLRKGQVRTWLADAATLELVEKIHARIDTLDDDVHSALLSGEERMALAPNARMMQLQEVLILMNDILEEAKGDSDE